MPQTPAYTGSQDVPRCPKSKLSGCSISAKISNDSASRGPSLLNHRFPSPIKAQHEMLLKHAALSYFFDNNNGPILDNGNLTISDEPGFGYEIDDDKVDSETEITF